MQLRKAVYDLSSVVYGCDAAVLRSDSGLHKCLAANLKANASGRYYLKSATQRQLIQVGVAVGVQLACRLRSFLNSRPWA